MSGDAPTEGWKWLHQSPKWHYFAADHRALCGKWMVLTLRGAEQGDDDSPDNCAICRKKRLKRLAG